jgi:hypothetical protein
LQGSADKEEEDRRKVEDWMQRWVNRREKITGR